MPESARSLLLKINAKSSNGWTLDSGILKTNAVSVRKCTKEEDENFYNSRLAEIGDHLKAKESAKVKEAEIKEKVNDAKATWMIGEIMVLTFMEEGGFC